MLAPTPTNQTGTPPCRVLILDDDPAFQGLIQDVLTMEPGRFEIAQAESGMQGVEQLASFRPDVVVLDVCLPDADGIDLLPMLRDLDPQVQLLVSTGFGTNARREAALRAGAVRFLEKPYDLMAFKALLLDLAARRPRLEGAGMTFLDLIQMMSVSRKTARFSFIAGDHHALLRFQDGELFHLEDDLGAGVSAFPRVAAWGEGTFQALHDPEGSTHLRTIHQPTCSLVLDLLQANETRIEPPEPTPESSKEPPMPSLKDHLRPFLDIDGVKVAVLVDWDGFVIDGVAREGTLGTEALGAVITTVLGSTQVIGRELNVGHAELAMLEYERGSVLFRVLGRTGILAVLLENQSSLGLLRFTIRKRAPEVEAALG